MSARTGPGSGKARWARSAQGGKGRGARDRGRSFRGLSPTHTGVSVSLSLESPIPSSSNRNHSASTPDRIRWGGIYAPDARLAPSLTLLEPAPVRDAVTTNTSNPHATSSGGSAIAASKELKIHPSSSLGKEP